MSLRFGGGWHRDMHEASPYDFWTFGYARIRIPIPLKHCRPGHSDVTSRATDDNVVL